MGTINERLRAAREATGLSQEAFGAKVGMSRSEIKNIEYGITSLKENKIPLILDAFGISEAWLRTGEGEMFIPQSRDEEIAAFVGKALSGESDSFKKRLLQVLSQLSEDEWELLEKKAKKLAGMD